MGKVRCNGLAKSRIVPVIWLVFRYWKKERGVEDQVFMVAHPFGWWKSTCFFLKLNTYQKHEGRRKLIIIKCNYLSYNWKKLTSGRQPKCFHFQILLHSPVQDFLWSFSVRQSILCSATPPVYMIPNHEGKRKRNLLHHKEGNTDEGYVIFL